MSIESSNIEHGAIRELHKPQGRIVNMGLFESSISLRGGLLRFIGSECPTLVNFVEDHGAIRELHKP